MDIIMKRMVLIQFCAIFRENLGKLSTECRLRETRQEIKIQD